MTLQSIQIQTHLTYKLGNADMDYLKFYVAKALGNNEQLTAKFTQSWRDSYQGDDLRRVFFNVMEKFNEKIQSLQKEISRLQQIEKQIKNYEQFKDYHFIIQRFNLVENARMDPRISLQTDPFDKKCAEIVQKMKCLEEKLVLVQQNKILKTNSQNMSMDIGNYRKVLQYINEPLMLKILLNKKENLIQLNTQEVENLNKILQVKSQLDKLKKVFQYYRTNLCEISDELQKSVISLDGLKKLIQIKKQSDNSWIKQNKYLIEANKCLSNLIENIQKSKQQITGSEIDKIKYQNSISLGIKEILKAFLLLLESDFSQMSISNLIEKIEKYSYKNKQVQSYIDKFLKIFMVEKENQSFQLELERIQILQLSSLQKPISMIKQIQKNLSFFSGILDNSKYHDKNRIQIMKKKFQASLARKLLIQMGGQKKYSIKESSLPNIIKKYPSEMMTQFKDALVKIDERNGKEKGYLKYIRFKLGQIYYNLSKKKYINPNTNPNDILFFSQMKSIVEELTKQSQISGTSTKKFQRKNNSSPQSNRSVTNQSQLIDSLQEQNKVKEIEIIGLKNQLEEMKLDKSRTKQQKDYFQSITIDLQNRIALFQTQKQEELFKLEVKYGKEKQIQLKLKQEERLERQQLSKELQKLRYNYMQQQSKYQFNQLQFKRQIKLLNEQIHITKEQLKKQNLLKEQLFKQKSLNNILHLKQQRIYTSSTRNSQSRSEFLTYDGQQYQKDYLIKQIMEIFITIIDKLNQQKSKFIQQGQKVFKSIYSLLIQKIDTFITRHNKYLTEHNIIQRQKMDGFINSLVYNWKGSSSQKEQEFKDVTQIDLMNQEKVRSQLQQKLIEIEQQKNRNSQLISQVNMLNEKCSSYIKEIGEMSPLIGKLKFQLSQLQSQKSKFTASQNKLSQLKQINTAILIQSTRAEQTKKIQIERLEQNISRLQSSKQQYQIKNKTLQEKIKNLQHVNKELQIERDILKQQLGSLESMIIAVNRDKEQLLKQLNGILNDQTIFKDKISKLDAVHSIKIQQKDNQLSQYKNKLVEQVDKLNKRIEQLSFQIYQINGQKNQLQNLVNQSQQLINQNNELKNKIQSFQRDNEQLLKNKCQLQEELTKYKVSHQKQYNFNLAELISNIEKLKKQLQIENKRQQQNKVKIFELQFDLKSQLQLNTQLKQTNQKQQQQLNTLKNTLSSVEQQHQLIINEKQKLITLVQQQTKKKLIEQKNQLQQQFKLKLIDQSKKLQQQFEYKLTDQKIQLQKQTEKKLTEQNHQIWKQSELKLIEQKIQLQKQFQQRLQQFKKQQQQPSIDSQQQRDFSQVTDVYTLQKQIKSKTKTNRNLLNSLYQLQEQIEQLKGQKTKLSKDLLEIKKSIDEIKKANQQQIKKLTIQRNRALQAVQKQKKAAEFKAIVEKNNTTSDSISQAEKLELGKVRSDLQNEKKLHKNNLQTKNKEILDLNQKINKLIAENDIAQKINYEQKQKIASYEQIVKVLNEQQKYTPTGDQHTIIFDRFFAGVCMDNQCAKKYQLFDLIQSKNKKQIQKTKFLYRFDPMNPTNFHNYIDGFENFLLIVRTPKCIFGAFSTSRMQNKFGESPNTISFLFSFADPKKIRAFDFNHNRIKGAKALSFDEFFLVIGNSQIRLRFQEKKVGSNFGIQNAFFDTNGYTVGGFLNEGNLREAELVSYECYQVIFK